MSKHLGYPQLNIQSKYDLANIISSTSFKYKDAVKLIKRVIINQDKYWRDSSFLSEPEKNKYVRNAKGTLLGKLLAKIDQKILLPHDSLIPDFIYGGISTRNHIQADWRLLGKRRGRTIIRMDFKRFFEQIAQERIFHFFHNKCGCSVEVSKLLARLCSVPEGKKGENKNGKRVLARGFATSTRLAVWCSMDTFYRAKWKADNLLAKHDPQTVVFVDDIGVSASRVTEEQMEKVYSALENVMLKDENQILRLNPDKKHIVPFKKIPKHLGLSLGRNKVFVSSDIQGKINWITDKLKNKKLSRADRRKLTEKKRNLYRYRAQVRNKPTL